MIKTRDQYIIAPVIQMLDASAAAHTSSRERVNALKKSYLTWTIEEMDYAIERYNVFCKADLDRQEILQIFKERQDKFDDFVGNQPNDDS